jgi:hypothetical protein
MSPRAPGVDGVACMGRTRTLVGIGLVIEELSAPAKALFCMNDLSNFLGRVINGLFKLVLLIAASVFVISFLLAALVVVVAVSLWSLITGRKPAPVVMFTRMREQSQRYTQGVWPGQTRQEPPGDVVDVQATEVEDDASVSRPGTR